MQVIDRTETVTQELIFINIKYRKGNIKKHKKYILNVFYVVLFCRFRAVLNIAFCTGHFVMVPINVTCLRCLYYFVFEHLFTIYLIKYVKY